MHPSSYNNPPMKPSAIPPYAPVQRRDRTKPVRRQHLSRQAWRAVEDALTDHEGWLLDEGGRSVQTISEFLAGYLHLKVSHGQVITALKTVNLYEKWRRTVQVAKASLMSNVRNTRTRDLIACVARLYAAQGWVLPDSLKESLITPASPAMPDIASQETDRMMSEISPKGGVIPIASSEM